MIFYKNSQNIVQVVNELSHIANTYANSSSNVEESMKEQEISVQDIAELATSLSWLSQELQELIGEFKKRIRRKFNSNQGVSPLLIMN